MKKPPNPSVCSLCKKSVSKIHDPGTHGKSVKFTDDSGRRWNGTTCPDCHGTDQRLRLRGRKGRGDRRSVTHPSWVKGVESEDIAADWFRASGYEVVQCDHNGPDLTVSRDSSIRTVEVKSVMYQSRNKMTVDQVRPNRRSDDWIAYVFRNGDVVVRPMFDHLKDGGGRRCSVTVWDPKYKPLPRSVHA